MMVWNFSCFLIFCAWIFHIVKSNSMQLDFLSVITKFSVSIHQNKIVHEGISFKSDYVIEKIASMIISRNCAEKCR